MVACQRCQDFRFPLTVQVSSRSTRSGKRQKADVLHGSAVARELARLGGEQWHIRTVAFKQPTPQVFQITGIKEDYGKTMDVVPKKAKADKDDVPKGDADDAGESEGDGADTEEETTKEDILLYVAEKLDGFKGALMLKEQLLQKVPKKLAAAEKKDDDADDCDTDDYKDEPKIKKAHSDATDFELVERTLGAARYFPTSPHLLSSLSCQSRTARMPFTIYRRALHQNA